MPYSVVYEKSFMPFWNKQKTFQNIKKFKAHSLGKEKYDAENGALGILYEMEISCFPHCLFISSYANLQWHLFFQ